MEAGGACEVGLGKVPAPSIVVISELVVASPDEGARVPEVMSVSFAFGIELFVIELFVIGSKLEVSFIIVLFVLS